MSTGSPRRSRTSAGAAAHLPPAAAHLIALEGTRHAPELRRGEGCPHCGGTGIAPWGAFSGRRRFRCRRCGRTFSTFTGTPLQHLKRLDVWPRLAAAIDDRDSIRRAAERLGVSPSTAFRWRHRVLSGWRRRDRTRVAGRVSLDLLWLAHSEKGRHPVGRPPRARGHRYAGWIPDRERVAVYLLHERDDATAAAISPTGTVGTTWLTSTVLPTMPRVSELVTILSLPVGVRTDACGGPVLVRRPDPGSGSRSAPQLARRLNGWLRPLRGVATRYLEHYVQWFRSDLAVGGPPPNSTREQNPRGPASGAVRAEPARIDGRPEPPPPRAEGRMPP